MTKPQSDEGTKGQKGPDRHDEGDTVDDRDSGFRPIVIIVVIALAAAAWFWFSRPETTQAIDEVVDVFVPDAESFQKRTSVIDEASRLVDELNSRR